MVNHKKVANLVGGAGGWGGGAESETRPSSQGAGAMMFVNVDTVNAE